MGYSTQISIAMIDCTVRFTFARREGHPRPCSGTVLVLTVPLLCDDREIPVFPVSLKLYCVLRRVRSLVACLLL